jgi:hypothetical protein
MPILQGCAQSGALKSLSVHISRDCENLAQPVPLVALEKGVNAKRVLAEERAAHSKANDNLDATRGCQARQRERLVRG